MSEQLDSRIALATGAGGGIGRAIAPALADAGAGAALVAQTPMGRFAEPEEVAHAVFCLVSDGASYVTGHTPCADGGWTAR